MACIKTVEKFLSVQKKFRNDKSGVKFIVEEVKNKRFKPIDRFVHNISTVIVVELKI